MEILGGGLISLFFQFITVIVFGFIGRLGGASSTQVLKELDDNI
jgi:hypothetical protein